MENIEHRKGDFQLVGYLSARLKRAGSDEFVDVWDKPKKNLIVNAGIALVADLISNASASSPSYFTHGRIGSDDTAPANGDTDVGTQLGNSEAVTPTRITTTVTNDTAQFVSSHACVGGPWSVKEYALANASSSGTILNRITFSTITLATDDVLEFTYKVQIQRV
jgi:hypothetical protein